MNQLRVLVVDHSLTMRAMLEQWLDADGELRVVATVHDAAEARAAIETLRPDVVTLDIDIPGMDGLAFLSELMAEHPMPVVMVAAAVGKGCARRAEALRRGAVACVSKEQLREDHRDFIRLLKSAARHRLRPERPETFLRGYIPLDAA